MTVAEQAVGRELHVDDHRFCVRGLEGAEDFTFLSYHFRPSERRPYIGVLAGSSGRNVLELTPADHAHHLGVWWSHGAVNGVDFYLELERDDVDHGRVEHVSFDEIVDDNPWFGFDEQLEWRDPDGVVLIREWRIVLAHFAQREWCTVDLDSTYTAAVDVTFGDTFESMLPGVRVAEPLAGWGGGTITTSAGAIGEAGAMGATADWLDCTGARRDFLSTPVVEGLAVMAHPTNPHPAQWWARDYGLVSPFPGHHFLGGGSLAAGDSLRMRHRLLAHTGSADDADVAGHFERWVSESALE
jgi:hypothetical protein